MIIKSDFKDYYDKGMGFDNEPNPMWIRKEEALPEMPDSVKNLVEDAPKSYECYDAVYYIIGFCGRFYLSVETDVDEFWKKIISQAPHYRRKILEETRDQKQKSGFRRAPFNQFCIDKFKEHLESFYRPDIFRELGVPTFVIKVESLGYRLNHCLTKNHKLHSIGFAKIKDPYLAFQEIDMFLSNEMATQPDPVPVRTEELIRDSKGFDNQSFKKEGKDISNQPDPELKSMIDNFKITPDFCYATIVDRIMSIRPTQGNFNHAARTLRKKFYSPQQKALAYLIVESLRHIDPESKKLLKKYHPGVEYLREIDPGR